MSTGEGEKAHPSPAGRSRYSLVDGSQVPFCRPAPLVRTLTDVQWRLDAVMRLRCIHSFLNTHFGGCACRAAQRTWRRMAPGPPRLGRWPWGSRRPSCGAAQAHTHLQKLARNRSQKYDSVCDLTLESAEKESWGCLSKVVVCIPQQCRCLQTSQAFDTMQLEIVQKIVRIDSSKPQGSHSSHTYSIAHSNSQHVIDVRSSIRQNVHRHLLQGGHRVLGVHHPQVVL